MRSLGRTRSVSVPCLVRASGGARFVALHSGLIFLFLGSFVALYRILLNAFPLLFPANVPLRLSLRALVKKLLPPSQFRDSATGDAPHSTAALEPQADPSPDNRPVTMKSARLSSAAQAHQTWLREKSVRWHSIIAGAVAGGVAISFENLSRQNVIAQQLFVRRVASSYVLPHQNSILCVRNIVVFKAHIMPIRRSTDSASHMGTSLFSHFRGSLSSNALLPS